MIYEVCIWCIRSRLQKTKRPKMTPANNYGTDRDTAGSGDFLAEISLRPPRKLLILIITKYAFWIKVSKQVINSILKKASLTAGSASIFEIK